MSNLTFVSDPWSGRYPKFTHCRYIGHNGGLPTYLLTNDNDTSWYGYPSTRDIIEGYLYSLGNVDEEEHKSEERELGGVHAGDLRVRTPRTNQRRRGVST